MALRSHSCDESWGHASTNKTGRSAWPLPVEISHGAVQRGGVVVELGFGVCIFVLSVGLTFIEESECSRAESVCTLLGGVLPAVVVSRIRSFLCAADFDVVTLPFAESTRVVSGWMRVADRVVS